MTVDTNKGCKFFNGIGSRSKLIMGDKQKLCKSESSFLTKYCKLMLIWHQLTVIEVNDFSWSVHLPS